MSGYYGRKKIASFTNIDHPKFSRYVDLRADLPVVVDVSVCLNVSVLNEDNAAPWFAGLVFYALGSNRESFQNMIHTHTLDFVTEASIGLEGQEVHGVVHIGVLIVLSGLLVRTPNINSVIQFDKRMGAVRRRDKTAVLNTAITEDAITSIRDMLDICPDLEKAYYYYVLSLFGDKSLAGGIAEELSEFLRFLGMNKIYAILRYIVDPQDVLMTSWILRGELIVFGDFLAKATSKYKNLFPYMALIDKREFLRFNKKSEIDKLYITAMCVGMLTDERLGNVGFKNITISDWAKLEPYSNMLLSTRGERMRSSRLPEIYNISSLDDFMKEF